MVKFGLAFDFRNPPQWRMPWDRLYAKTLEQVKYAETLGYDAIWLTEHHFIDDGYSPSLLPLAAAVAAQTKRVQIGTAVLLLPLHNAIRIAEDAAVVDLISGGRFMLGVSQGYRAEEFRTFGVPVKERLSRFEESVDLIKRAWTESPLTFHGRYYHLEGVRVTPPPLQQPRPFIWIGGSTDGAARRAARLGDGFLGNNVAQSQVYRQHLQETGGSQAQPRIARALVLYVSEDPEKEWHALKDHFLYRYNLYYRWFSEVGLVSPLHRTVGELTDPEELRKMSPNLVVDPAACVEVVKQHAQEEGVTHMYFAATLPGVDPERTVSSMELFAKKVMPHFR